MRKTILLYETRAPSGCNFIYRILLNIALDSVDEFMDIKIHICVESTTVVRSKFRPSECVPHRNQ